MIKRTQQYFIRYAHVIITCSFSAYIRIVQVFFKSVSLPHLMLAKVTLLLVLLLLLLLLNLLGYIYIYICRSQ
jgi:hypothetical protein